MPLYLSEGYSLRLRIGPCVGGRRTSWADRLAADPAVNLGAYSTLMFMGGVPAVPTTAFADVEAYDARDCNQRNNRNSKEHQVIVVLAHGLACEGSLSGATLCSYHSCCEDGGVVRRGHGRAAHYCGRLYAGKGA